METYLITSGAGLWIAQTMLGGSYSWLIVLGAFMGVSMLAQWWANSQTSKGLQYMGLLLFIVAESIVFLPLLFMAAVRSDGAEIFAKAGITTLGLFAGLTATVFFTRKDFSFLAPVLTIGGFVALGFIAASILFGFSLGNVFALVMVLFAGGRFCMTHRIFCIITAPTSTLPLRFRYSPASRFFSGIFCGFLWVREIN
jgi:FtsH-binding integral membrane protein